MSNYLSVHICSPARIAVRRNGSMADIGFIDDIDPTGKRVSVTFGTNARDRLLRLRDACDEALGLLNVIEDEEADAQAQAQHNAGVL